MTHLKTGSIHLLPEVHLYIFRRWKDFVSVILVCVLRMLAGPQPHVKAGENGHQVPFDLQQGVTLAWTERTEGHQRMLEGLIVLVERLVVAETVVLEYLHNTKNKTKKTHY